MGVKVLYIKVPMFTPSLPSRDLQVFILCGELLLSRTFWNSLQLHIFSSGFIPISKRPQVLNGNHYLIFTKIIKNSTNFIRRPFSFLQAIYFSSLLTYTHSSLKKIFILFHNIKWLQYLFCITKKKVSHSKIQTKTFWYTFLLYFQVNIFLLF